MTTRATESSATSSIRRASPQMQRHAGLVRVHVLLGAEFRCLEAVVERVGDVRFASADAEVRGRSGAAATRGHAGRRYRAVRQAPDVRDQPRHGETPIGSIPPSRSIPLSMAVTLGGGCVSSRALSPGQGLRPGPSPVRTADRVVERAPAPRCSAVAITSVSGKRSDRCRPRRCAACSAMGYGG